MYADIVATGRLVGTFGRCQLIHIADPERALSSNQVGYLMPALGEVASEGFGHQVTPDSLRRHMLVGQNHLLLVGADPAFVGFASAKDLSEAHSIFVTGMVLAPGYQGKGLGSGMFHAFLEVTGCRLLAFTTQSPVLYRMLSRLGTKVYPGLTVGRIPPELQAMGSRVMEGRRGKFFPSSFVCRELYPQCLYPKFPWCSDLSINAFFREMLHFEEEETRDGFLLVGEISG